MFRSTTPTGTTWAKGGVSQDLDPFLLSVGHRRSAIGFPCQRFSALLHTQYVGKQYFTNGRNDALSLDDYCVTNLNLGYELAASKIGSVRFGVQINNLFNTEYCNNGYGYSSIVGGVREDSAFYFPQAMFNVLANVTVRF